MSRQLDKKQIDEALERLNQRMFYQQMESIGIVVCGAAALVARNLVSRSTSDVDILALADLRSRGRTEVSFLQEKELPDKLIELISDVGNELHIRQDWLNFKAISVFQYGLPPGIEKRLERKKYGECLTVFFLTKHDQIHLKLLAALDPEQGERHLSDLLDLQPQDENSTVKAAVGWLLNRKVSTDYKRKLKQVLDRIGHERIAAEIPD